MTSDNLDSIRESIRVIDDKILELGAQRMELCRAIGRYKKKQNLPIKDYQVEREIIDRAKDRGKHLGIDSDLAESIIKSLIHHSVLEQRNLMAPSSPKNSPGKNKNISPKNICIIGGKGNMGHWMAQFFHSMGHDIKIHDNVEGGQSEFSCFSTIKEATQWADILVLATPMSETGKILDDLLELGGNSAIIEICSLKSPVAEALNRLEKSGRPVLSLHPMFGPDADILFDRNIIVCETEEPIDQCFDTIIDQLQTTSANIIRIPFNQHDYYMSYILGSAHLINLLYARLLQRSPFTIEELESVAGTSFQAQLDVTRKVAAENQDLYFEIQSLNKESYRIYDELKLALTYMECEVAENNLKSFKKAMAACHEYLK